MKEVTDITSRDFSVVTCTTVVTLSSTITLTVSSYTDTVPPPSKDSFSMY